MKERGMLYRIAAVALVLFLGLLGLIGRLGYLHLGNHSKIAWEFNSETLGLRGTIYDCYGTSYPMAVSLPARLYFIDPQAVNKKHTHKINEMAKTVAACMKLPVEQVLSYYAPTNASRYNKLGITSDDRIYDILGNKTNISGVASQDITIRTYPQGSRMAHVLGFVDKNDGGYGLERSLDRYLKGTPGRITGVKAARGGEIRDRRRLDVQPIPGANVFLTLDHNIQFEVEKVLEETVQQFKAIGGWSIVQEVNTGRILAMAVYPSFDPVNYSQETGDVWRNNAIGKIYEPGSIMKAISVAAVLNERLVTPNTLIDVGAGTWFYANKPLRDHVTGHITVSTALAKSSNIACAKMGLMLGPDRIERYLRAFGFGDKLGIDLSGEEQGLLGRAKTWDGLKPTRIPIGQGVAVTAIQMINAYSTLANGGTLYRPYAIDRIVAANGEVIFQNTPTAIGRPVRPEVAKQVREMLIGVTEEGGTGKRANVKGYTIAGKTGTAQKAVPGGYSSTDYYASFVGFLPAHKPVVSILVSIDRPQPIHTGGYVAAPAFAKIAAATARIREIPPDLPEQLVQEEQE